MLLKKINVLKNSVEGFKSLSENILKSISNKEIAYEIVSLNCFEHPHGGLIAIFLVKLSIESKSGLKNKYFIFKSRYSLDSDNSFSETWSKVELIYEIKIVSKENEKEIVENINFISLTSFINLRGNLQIFYSLKNKMYSMESNNYGRTFTKPSLVFESFHPFKLINQILINEKGFILIPAKNLDNGISFVLISENLSKDWSVSALIEPYNYDDMIENGIFPRTISQSLIPLGENTLESLILFEFPTQKENNSPGVKDKSEDSPINWSGIIFNSRSEHSGYTWNEATPFFKKKKSDMDRNTISEEHGNLIVFKAGRLLDDMKNYAPKIFLCELRKNSIALKIIPINEIGIDTANYKTKFFHLEDIKNNSAPLKQELFKISDKISENQISFSQTSTNELHMLIFNPCYDTYNSDNSDTSDTSDIQNNSLNSNDNKKEEIKKEKDINLRGELIHLIFEL